MARKEITVLLTLPNGDEKKYETRQGVLVEEFLHEGYLKLVKIGKLILRKKGGDIVTSAQMEYFRATEGLHLELVENTPSAAPPMPEPPGPAIKR